jgi:predicted lipid-binding transport protein (Tim44 family)
VSPIDREEAARKAAEELLKPEYEKEALFDRIYRYVTQFLGDLLDAATGGGSAGGIIAAVLITLILLGLIALIAWRLRKTARRRWPRREGRRGTA